MFFFDTVPLAERWLLHVDIEVLFPTVGGFLLLLDVEFQLPL